jgi:hypothetical protein
MIRFSQDEWECNLNLTYPSFKLNGLRTTGLSTFAPNVKSFCIVWQASRTFVEMLQRNSSTIFREFSVIVKTWGFKWPLR